jgi:hypothetical protein
MSRWWLVMCGGSLRLGPSSIEIILIIDSSSQHVQGFRNNSIKISPECLISLAVDEQVGTSRMATTQFAKSEAIDF